MFAKISKVSLQTSLHIKNLKQVIGKKSSNSLIKYHIPFSNEDVDKMMSVADFKSKNDFQDQCVPLSIRQLIGSSVKLRAPPEIPEVLKEMEIMMSKNLTVQSFIGQGFYETHIPSIVKRCVFENPKWYTAYTPYQAEISQGRLEALFNYQIMIKRITKMDVSNACLLDEASAGAEAVIMAYHVHNGERKTVLIQKNVFKNTKAVIKSTVEELGIKVIEIDQVTDQIIKEHGSQLIGFVGQSPDMFGFLNDFSNDIKKVKSVGGLSMIATDLLSCIIAKTPGEMDADITFGNCQRFGTPIGFGGPHAAFFATKKEFVRKMPGRIVSACFDVLNKQGFRMAMQTREQHIRRERATSNICTSQVLLANINFFYALYHGEEGLKKISNNVHKKAISMIKALNDAGVEVLTKNNNSNGYIFDTFTIVVPKADEFIHNMALAKFCLYKIDDQHVSISMDEVKDDASIRKLTKRIIKAVGTENLKINPGKHVPELTSSMLRANKQIFNKDDIIHKIKGEHEILRYITKLENKDITLCNSMIPLGSCTMKLNSAFELEFVAHSKVNIHPYLPRKFIAGFEEMLSKLSVYLCEITGMNGVTYQSNSGSTGEYVGLKIMKSHFKHIHQEKRDVILIPSSAHGTNPASAAKIGLKIIVVKAHDNGYVDIQDLKQKIEENKDNLFGMMLTFPSTHGVFEEETRTMTEAIHKAGGLVYIDGANMNAQLGLTNPGFIGGDVCHLNLHKTFAIPHGGGGPGMGPVLIKKFLLPYIPTHAENPFCGFDEEGKILSSNHPQTLSSPFGSASILTISYMYSHALGFRGLMECSKQAILSANYLATVLSKHYAILYTNKVGRVAHEFILDIRPIKSQTGITEEDIAKRLMDYNFHAPTMSFPVPGTLMIEPTESESLEELNRFAEAMIQIKSEINDVKLGLYDAIDNPLKNAPHTLEEVLKTDWKHKYSREVAGFPLPWLRKIGKIWPGVSRINSVQAEKNLMFELPEEAIKS